MEGFSDIRFIILKIWAILVSIITSGGLVLMGMLFYMAIKGDFEDRKSKKYHSFWWR